MQPESATEMVDISRHLDIGASGHNFTALHCPATTAAYDVRCRRAASVVYRRTPSRARRRVATLSLATERRPTSLPLTTRSQADIGDHGRCGTHYDFSTGYDVFMPPGSEGAPANRAAADRGCPTLRLGGTSEWLDENRRSGITPAVTRNEPSRLTRKEPSSRAAPEGV